MRIAVTGGSGFVGFHLVRELSESGHEVIILDKVPPATSEFSYCQIDLTDLESLRKGLEKVDTVYHLGAIADASLAYKDYKMTFDVNVIGTYNVLEASRLNNVKKVVYASTIWVYNASTITEVDETSQFTTNTNHLSTNKIENLIISLIRKCGFTTFNQIFYKNKLTSLLTTTSDC